MTTDNGGMMHDERLDQLLGEARETYRAPSTPPDFEALWARVEHDAFDVPATTLPVVADTLAIDGVRVVPRRRSWLAPAAGIAATLLIGVGIGRVTAPGTATTATPAVADASTAVPATAVRLAPASHVAEPLQRATFEYLARAVTLLDSLPRSAQGASLGGDARFVSDAAQLLGTTRLLLDSPAAQDPRMRDLLEDLELVLAQVARLRTAPRADELTFIAEAMDSRDVVPRLRTVAASYTASGF